jgi:hypothetical protein
MKKKLVLTCVFVLCIALSGSFIYAEAEKEEQIKAVEETALDVLDYDSLIGMKDKLGLNEEQVKKISELKAKDKSMADELSQKEKLIQQLEMEKKAEKIEADQVKKLEKEIMDAKEMIKKKKMASMADLQEILTKEQMEKYEMMCAKRESKPLGKAEEKPKKIESEKKDK